MNGHRPLAFALLLDVLGAGGALLSSIQTWQRLSAAREGPFPDAKVALSGRDVDSAITALALVALAGVVAVLATRGRWRRLVGAVVAVAGAGLVTRAVVSVGAVDNDRAISFITAKRQTVTVLPQTAVRIDVIGAWAALSILCGLLVFAAGTVIAVRGGHWQGMSARYVRAQRSGEPQTDAAVAPDEATANTDDDAADSGRAAATMWSALDRGEDPTAPTVR